MEVLTVYINTEYYVNGHQLFKSIILGEDGSLWFRVGKDDIDLQCLSFQRIYSSSMLYDLIRILS